MTITLKAPALKRPKLPKISLPKVSRNVAELASQATGVISVLIGVSMWSLPCAFILGGLTLVAAVERQAVPSAIR